MAFIEDVDSWKPARKPIPKFDDHFRIGYGVDVDVLPSHEHQAAAIRYTKKRTKDGAAKYLRPELRENVLKCGNKIRERRSQSLILRPGRLISFGLASEVLLGFL